MDDRRKSMVICSNPECGIEFLKSQSEINRNKKIGRKNYCSLSCNGKSNNKHLVNHSKSEKNREFLKTIAGSKKDKYTGLREHLTRVKKRDKNHNITLDDLLEQWNNQNGICVYSGVKLKTPHLKCSPLEKASLDRIDSNKGYVKGNIQFISVVCNHAKNDMTHEQMVDFCKIISKAWIV